MASERGRLSVQHGPISCSCPARSGPISSPSLADSHRYGRTGSVFLLSDSHSLAPPRPVLPTSRPRPAPRIARLSLIATTVTIATHCSCYVIIVAIDSALTSAPLLQVQLQLQLLCYELNHLVGKPVTALVPSAPSTVVMDQPIMARVLFHSHPRLSEGT